MAKQPLIGSSPLLMTKNAQPLVIHMWDYYLTNLESPPLLYETIGGGGILFSYKES